MMGDKGNEQREREEGQQTGRGAGGSDGLRHSAEAAEGRVPGAASQPCAHFLLEAPAPSPAFRPRPSPLLGPLHLPPPANPFSPPVRVIATPPIATRKREPGDVCVWLRAWAANGVGGRRVINF